MEVPIPAPCETTAVAPQGSGPATLPEVFNVDASGPLLGDAGMPRKGSMSEPVIKSVDSEGSPLAKALHHAATIPHLAKDRGAIADLAASITGGGESLRRSALTFPEGHCNEEAAPQAFENAEEIKDKARKCATKVEYDVKSFYFEEGYAQNIARSNSFELATTAAIGLNSIWIWIDADYNKEEVLTEAHPVFQIGEHFFCLFFFLEWLCRFIAFEFKRNAFRDAWFLFDSVLVSLMVFETWVMTLILLLSSSGSSAPGLGNASILRLLRLMRLTRISRMARLLRAMPELLFMIKGIVAATRSVFFTMLLLIFILYVFAIMIRQLSDGTKMGKDLFPTVWRSIGTLIIQGALVDSPTATMTAILAESKASAFAYSMVVFLAAFTVMNMLVGVLCEVVSDVASREKEDMAVTFVRGKINTILSCSGMDSNQDQLICAEEFSKLLEYPEAVSALGEVGVDVEALIDYADIIFQSDTKGHKFERNLGFSEFMDLVLQLRGTNNATLKDVSDLRKFIQSQNNNRNRQFTTLEARVANLEVYQREMGESQLKMKDDVDWLLSALLPMVAHTIHSKTDDASVKKVGSTPDTAQTMQRVPERSELPMSSKDADGALIFSDDESV